MGEVTRMNPRRPRKILAWALVMAAIGGCGGGSVDVGSGQGPDPAIPDIPIAYVRRPVPLDGGGTQVAADVRQLRTFFSGADLWLRDQASPSATPRNVTNRITQGSGLWDIRDLEISYDGTKVLFAMRGPFDPGADEDEQPTWNIWEYTIAADELRRVITVDASAEAGHDVAPNYLPDGRIIFSSTRQRQSKAILLDEGKPQFEAQDEDRREPAFVLHVMNADGSDIHQVSFNQSHDLDPAVLANGQVVFSRWDGAGSRSAVHLYRMNPDGTGLEMYYGANSHATGTGGATVQFTQPRELPDGRLLVMERPFQAADWGGDVIVVDAANYLENLQPTAVNAGTLSGPAQQPATQNVVHTDGTISPGGTYNGAFPLWDGSARMFVSWSPCRLLAGGSNVPCTTQALANPGAVAAPPLYGIWLYDMAAGTQAPVFLPEEGFIYTDVVAAEVRPVPPVIFDQDSTGQLDPDLVAEGVGLIRIRSVYDLDGTASANIAQLANPAQTLAAARPARFLRIEKAVSLPDDEVRDFDNSAFGVSTQQGMRDIIGYVPIEPDGSVVAKVPADMPLALSVLDGNGRRTSERHQNWLQLRAGQVLSCNGCHVPDGTQSHGRQAAYDSAWAGAPADAQPFPNTEPALYADFGETMAEVKERISCATDCALITPAVDVAYTDIWTHEATAGRAKDEPFAWRYADLSTPAPTQVDCLSGWSAACRVTINYEAHIHPLWSVDRRVFDTDGITLLADNTCTSCHAPADAQAAAQVPAAQLDLTDGISDIDANHFKAYRELYSADNEQELNGGVLQDRLVQVGTDPVTGDPVFAPVPVDPSMSVAGAIASARFFGIFAAGASHAGRLSDAELKLLSEWADIGGQYYNNPFDAPAN
jgi:hypothetical protein